MELLIAPASPFVRKARVAVRELDLMDAVTELEVTASPVLEVTEALIAANPTGKIPALTRPDGPAIYDSRVITRFLNAHAAGNLYPEARLWEVLTLEATAEAIMDASVSMTYEVRFREADKVSADWVEGQWRKVTRSLVAIEARWLSHLSGPLDMAQIGLACALGYLDLRHDARGWRNTAPKVAEWEAIFAQRPSMLDTRPD
ncbi:MAG: glutathione S-transferase [Sulfitobacter sp.]|jgi:glutathione S-transferase